MVPRLLRRAEPLLPLQEDVIGKDPVHRPPEQVLAGKVLVSHGVLFPSGIDEVASRKSGDKIDQLMVEQRNPRLQGMGHAELVLDDQ